MSEAYEWQDRNIHQRYGAASASRAEPSRFDWPERRKRRREARSTRTCRTQDVAILGEFDGRKTVQNPVEHLDECSPIRSFAVDAYRFCGIPPTTGTHGARLKQDPGELHLDEVTSRSPSGSSVSTSSAWS